MVVLLNGVTNMHYRKYRLFVEVELLGKNSYNGDAYTFISKDWPAPEIIRFKNHKKYLYDILMEKDISSSCLSVKVIM